MDTNEDFKAVIDEIKNSTNKIAEDQIRLIDKLSGGGLTPQQEGEVLAELRAHAAKLKTIDEAVADEEVIDPQADAGSDEITG